MKVSLRAEFKQRAREALHRNLYDPNAQIGTSHDSGLTGGLMDECRLARTVAGLPVP
jgi:hypothetical protein